MELVRVTSDAGWQRIERLLCQAVARCEQRGVPLWHYEQVTRASLLQAYPGAQPYVFRHDGCDVGCVFLQVGEDDFWHDHADMSDAVYFHKLAMGDEFASRGLGQQALSVLLNFARTQQVSWLRCDCHAGRPELRAFYQRFGFAFAGIHPIEEFEVAKYQMAVMPAE